MLRVNVSKSMNAVNVLTRCCVFENKNNDMNGMSVVNPNSIKQP